MGYGSQVSLDKALSLFFHEAVKSFPGKKFRSIFGVILIGFHQS